MAEPPSFFIYVNRVTSPSPVLKPLVHSSNLGRRSFFAYSSKNNLIILLLPPEEPRTPHNVI